MDRYKVVELLRSTDAGITRELNEMAAKGWRFVQGWDRATPSPRTTLVFEREQQPEKHTLLSDEMALDWTTVQPDYGDSILKREMAAARDDARPVEDPLIKGLTR